ncbi:class I SAM-dependent methyltransferase [Synoicihabitans lomoniglobus]|uniref:Class I SAM-dependent methyltransferase n=1 Tax=Synoicihabitans lomoniglobus TaxID=2909285 RepID=A0AAF0CSW0_9BACT|nr:class I SAM-dependent methyltransferase [Opitutaceae bacterium LMO-M01]WED67494.1 class I SAM-dependent methyltransferase [Opitutaceae bacterium LMO-M01]
MNESDPKQGEREYYARKGPEGIAHALGKPFSDDHCKFNLANLAAIFHLLPAPPIRLLHLGCGVGWLSHILAQQRHEVVGVDIAPEAIAAAQHRRDEAGLSNLDYEVGDYEYFDGAESFDVVLFYDALHHAEEPAKAMACAHRALKANGALIAFEPGSGHHDSPTSQEAIERFGVHERDMPVSRIIELGEAAGFRRHLRLPHPADTLAELYHPGYSTATDQADLDRKKLDHTWQITRQVMRRNAPMEIVMLWK